MKKDKNGIPKKIYLVWQEKDDGEEKYFTIYNTIEEAVSVEHGEWENGEVEVYEASPKFIGTYRLTTKTVKIKG